MRRQSHCGRCSGKKAQRSGSSSRNLEKAVLIDVDLDSPNDGFDNVIIIDAPETSNKELSGSRKFKGGKRSSYQGVISIDDDDTDSEGNPEKNVDTKNHASSSRNDFVPDFMQSPQKVDQSRGFVNPKKNSASKPSKCKTYSEKTSCGKRYGLSPDFESTSSDSSSDCELMEGSGGNLGEQWERAFQRRKYGGSSSRKSGMEDHINVEADRTEQPTEVPVCSSSSVDTDVQKQNLSAFEAGSQGITGDTELNPGTKCPLRESDKKVDNRTDLSPKKADVLSEKDALTKDPSPNFNEQKSYKHVYDGGSSFGCSKQSFEGSSSCSTIHNDDTGNPFKCRDQNIKRGCSDIPTSANIHSDVSATSLQKNVPSVSSVAQSNENQLQQSCSIAAEDTLHSMPKSQKCDTSDSLGGDATPSGQRDVITDREKLKETDEFKRAVEEEWASRQRELKLQAEEAQRLRKRKKAESMRLLDMEKRQKQRVEEMRETQKKVEANMSVKEQHRTVVRKELSKLELSCKDMASLLRGLGIQVDGGFRPLSNQVRSAYKQALLRFHPDRASTTDIRQQVEAEEKFKLISRMKEKFLPAT